MPGRPQAESAYTTARAGGMCSQAVWRNTPSHALSVSSASHCVASIFFSRKTPKNEMFFLWKVLSSSILIHAVSIHPFLVLSCFIAFGFINNLNGPVSAPAPSVAFYVAKVSRRPTPLTPNAKSSMSTFRSLLNLANHLVCQKARVLMVPCVCSPQPPGGIPGSQPLLPNSLDPTRPPGEKNHRDIC